MGDRLGTLGAVGSHFSYFFGFNFKRTLFALYTSFSSLVKFICCVKASKFCKISTNYLSDVLPVKKLGEISQNFVAFSEYMNFNRHSFVIGLKSRGSSLTREKTGSLDLQIRHTFDLCLVWPY
jgi:hypothetical protein